MGETAMLAGHGDDLVPTSPYPYDQARAGGSTDSGTTIPFCFANSGRAQGKSVDNRLDVSQVFLAVRM